MSSWARRAFPYVGLEMLLIFFAVNPTTMMLTMPRIVRPSQTAPTTSPVLGPCCEAWLMRASTEAFICVSFAFGSPATQSGMSSFDSTHAPRLMAATTSPTAARATTRSTTTQMTAAWASVAWNTNL